MSAQPEVSGRSQPISATIPFADGTKSRIIDEDIITYNAAPTVAKFHVDDNFVRLLIGPIGSGKSVGCVFELLMRATEQRPDRKGIRASRWAIIRNTYRELIDTTMETFFTWIPKKLGEYSAQNMKFTLVRPLPDGTIVHAEFLFRALDRPQDIKKLLSLDLTGAWINEMRELPKAVFDMLIGRCGRYPSMMDGASTWHGVIGDTNPPDSDHWIYRLFEEDCPDNYSIFHQPSGVSEEAENLENLPPDYYKNMMAGKDLEWLKVYIHGQYGFVMDGKPVFPEYNDHLHYIDERFKPDNKTKIYIGIDFGLTPAAVFGQPTASGAVVVFDELVTFDMGAVSFGRLLYEKIRQLYPYHFDNGLIEMIGDPAGTGRAQTDEQTPFQILEKQGLIAIPAYTNDFTVRREVIAERLMRLDFSGRAALRLTSDCPMLRKAFNGGYQYRRLQVSGDDAFKDEPTKNKFSHVSDALQYMMLGAVGDDRIIGGFNSGKDLTPDSRGII